MNADNETHARLRVWAPTPTSVELVRGDGARTPMQRQDDGWWAVAHPGMGVDYGYSLDGADPLPDPRSLWQPHGVHGLSRTFDTQAHTWSDTAWPGPREGRGGLGGVFYELHVGTFTSEGTLDAAVERLPHLVELGIDVVELMPLAQFGGNAGWGYDGVDLYAVHQAYGGPAALQRFVDACHAVGLGVCLDVVYNHLGPTGNHLASFGPYFTDTHVTPWGPAVNLDAEGSAQVRRFVIDNALMWLRDFHVDALRIDAVHALRDDSPRHLLAQLSDEVALLAARLGRSLELIAESDLNDERMVCPTSEGGLGMHAQWDDDAHHALHVALTGEADGYYADFSGATPALAQQGPIEVLAKAMRHVFVHDGVMSSFRGQVWGRPVDLQARSGHQFLAFLQNHDQVGNRATGDRIGASISPGLQAIGAALYLLSPFTAMVFMGEEWRASTPFQFFSDFEEEWLAEAVRTGRRAEFAAHGWGEQDVPDPQSALTRLASTLRWAELGLPEHAEMMSHYRSLIAIRRSEPDIASGDLTAVRVGFDEDRRWIVVSRGRVHVVANLAESAQTVPFAHDVEQTLLGWRRAAPHVPGGFALDAHDVVVVRSR